MLKNIYNLNILIYLQNTRAVNLDATFSKYYYVLTGNLYFKEVIIKTREKIK